MSRGFELPHPSTRVLPGDIRLSNPPGYSHSAHSSKIVGCLVGLALGDALGASVEFRPHDYLAANPITTIQGGGTWGLPAGRWTDDTSMALCLASSLITQHGYNPYDQLVKYKWWYQRGFLSATGTCFDIGGTTRAALEEFARGQNIIKEHLRQSNDDVIDRLSVQEAQAANPSILRCGMRDKAGNGPLMRLAPIPLFFYRQPALAVQRAGESAALTHNHLDAIDACRYFAALIVAAVRGAPREELLDVQFYERHSDWFGSQRLSPAVLEVVHGSFKKHRGYDDGIRGAGYIVKTLEAALWAFWKDDGSFKKGACHAVNLGDDTDTTAAVYGQLAGAHYGYDKLPRDWMDMLYAKDLIIKFGQWLDFEGGTKTTDMPNLSSQRLPPQPTYPAYQALPMTQTGRYGYGPQTKFEAPTTQPGRFSYDPLTRGEKKKIDPSTMPPAGVKSGGNRH